MSVTRTTVATPRSMKPTNCESRMSSLTLPVATSSHVDRRRERSISPRRVPRCYGAKPCTYLYNTRHLGGLRRGPDLAFPARPDLHPLVSRPRVIGEEVPC